jgi:hypothetical protein
MNAIFRVAFTAWSVLVLGLVQVQASEVGGCNRTCLEGMISAYLTALAAHDPSSLPVTTEVKYVENNEVLPLGTGEWAVAGAPGTYRHIFADPEAGQVAAITTITENGVGAIYIARLQVEEDGKISEIETQITRDPGGAARYDKLGQPEAVWLEAVPVAQRLPRAMLIAQSDKYYSGMENNDPKGDYSFFDSNCSRLEDATQTTNEKNGDPYGHSNDTIFASLSCEAQFQTGFLGFVTKIRERRFPVVDEERQAVLAVTILDHNATVRFLPGVNGTSSPIPAYFDVPRTLQATEGFRLRGDKLFRIEMTLTEIPYGVHSAFYTGPPVDVRGAGTNATTASPCDRACLKDVVEQVLQAMRLNASSGLPLAEGVRYSENGQFLALGDGLWETLGQVASPDEGYAAVFAEPASGAAAYWGLTQEHSTQGVLALRVKVDGGQITEIEAVIVRAESSGSRYGTLTLMRPPLPVEWEGDPLGGLDSVFEQDVFQQNGTGANTTGIPPTLIAAYFDGLEQHSSTGVPFASGCRRRDNGMQGNLSCAAQMDGNGTSPNGLYNLTTTVRDRRVLVEDASKGVVLAIAMVDYPAIGPLPLPATELVPSTYMVSQLIKIHNGSISRVESMIKWMPFGYTSAWAEEKPIISKQ